MPEVQPSSATEHAWLTEGIQSGKLREQTAIEIMKLLDHTPSKQNDEAVYSIPFPAKESA